MKSRLHLSQMGRIPVRIEWDTEQDSQHEMQLIVDEWWADFISTQTAASGGEAVHSSEVTLKKYSNHSYRV